MAEYRCYLLNDGVTFRTSAYPIAADRYIQVWDVTRDDAIEISQGAILSVVDGALVIQTVPLVIAEAPEFSNEGAPDPNAEPEPDPPVEP